MQEIIIEVCNALNIPFRIWDIEGGKERVNFQELPNNQYRIKIQTPKSSNEYNQIENQIINAFESSGYVVLDKKNLDTTGRRFIVEMLFG